MVTLTFEKKLKDYIHEIEEKSPIEIVPVIVKKASHYPAWAMVYGLVFSFIPAELLASRIPLWGPWVLLIDFFLWLFLGFIVAFGLKHLRFFSRLIPHELQQQSVMQMADTLFLHEGVTETQQRLGIMIAVFEFEKSVVVLADKGFAPHVKSEYWAKLGVTLAKDFNQKKPGDEFFAALKQIEKDIAPHFKMKGTHQSEISDDLRKR